jgi:predicted PurR-regulated permease PerM
MDFSKQKRGMVTVLVLGGGGALVFAEVVRSILGKIWFLVMPVGISLFFSFAIEPAVARLEKRMRRGVATFLVMLAALVAIGAIAGVGGAVILSEGQDLLDNLPSIVQNVEDRLNDLGLRVDFSDELRPGGTVEGLREAAFDRIQSFSGSVLEGLGTLLPMLFMIFYFTADNRRLIRSACALLVPDRQQHVVRAWELAIEKAGGYLYSRIVLAGISTIVHSLAFLVVGVDYPIPVGIWVGMVSQVVPVVGTYLAGALPVLVALGVSPGRVVAVLLVIVVYQQIENMYLAPKVTRNAIDMHPLAGLISILAGWALLGWIGALVAVPVCATMMAFFSAFLPKHDVVVQLPGGPASGDEPPEPQP